MTEIPNTEKALANQSKLSENERQIYQNAVDNGDLCLSLKPSSELYSLFLQGHSCEDIQKLNPQFSINTIVRTRVEHEWDRHKSEYLDVLYKDIHDKALQTQAETFHFARDGMAAFHKLMGQKFQRYLQTGDVSELGNLREMSIKNYKDLFEIMQKATGAANTKQVEVLHKHQMQEQINVVDVTPTEVSKDAEIDRSKPIDPMDAFAYLQKIARGDKDE